MRQMIAIVIILCLTCSSLAAADDPQPSPSRGSRPSQTLSSSANRKAHGKVMVRATLAAGQIYLDTRFPDHWEIGGSVGLLLSPRVAVEAELLSFQSYVPYLPNEFKYVAGASLLLFQGAQDSRPRMYWIGGFTTRFGGQANKDVWPQGGFGVQFLSDRPVSLAVEARAPLARASVSVVYRLP